MSQGQLGAISLWGEPREASVLSAVVPAVIHRGKTTLENCVLQCETTGVTVRTSAEFLMKTSDLYGAKVCGPRVLLGSSPGRSSK